MVDTLIMHPVDALLAQARTLLGNLGTPQLTPLNPGTAVPAPAVWSGSAADAAVTASDQLNAHRGQLHSAHTAAGTVITEAAQISRDAHTQLRTVEVAWASDKAAVGPYANTAVGQAALLRAGQQRVQEATMVVQTAAERFQGSAQQLNGVIGQLPQSGGKSDTQALGFGPQPQSPAPKDPPHGKDPRYWIDVDQLKYVPDGKLAPNGYVQVGPNLYHPLPGYPPGSTLPPAKLPLDVEDLVQVKPGQLGPAHTKEILPGWFTPVPLPGETFSPPKQPVDIRDIIQVPKGTLAPYNYFEYLPGWFAPKTIDPPVIPRLDGRP